MLALVLGWSGLTSLGLGGVVALVGIAKGTEARQLGAATPLANLSELKQLLSLVPLVVAVTGRVIAAHPLKGDLSGTEAAIVQVNESKQAERLVSGIWLDDSTPLREITKETEWCLEDGTKTQLPVVNGRKATGDFLQVNGNVLIPSNQGIVARTANEVLGSRDLGLRRTELSLPQGTLLTAVGELVAEVEHPSAFQGAALQGGKMLVLRKPAGGGPFMLSRQPLPEVIASLQAASQACQQWATALTLVGVGLLAAAGAQHALTWLKRRRLQRRVDRALRERDARAAARAASGSGEGGSAAGGRDEGDGVVVDGVDRGAAGGRGLCVVCLDKTADTVFPGCGHMCACSGCSPSLGRCPLCRCRGQALRVYMS